MAWVQITDTVYPMYKAFIEPDLNTAHLKIYNNFNPFSGFMAPTYILKSAKTVTPDAIKAVLKVQSYLICMSLPWPVKFCFGYSQACKKKASAVIRFHFYSGL